MSIHNGYHLSPLLTRFYMSNSPYPHNKMCGSPFTSYPTHRAVMCLSNRWCACSTQSSRSAHVEPMWKQAEVVFQIIIFSYSTHRNSIFTSTRFLCWSSHTRAISLGLQPYCLEVPLSGTFCHVNISPRHLSPTDPPPLAIATMSGCPRHRTSSCEP
jgi:hypothetical protein